MTPLRRAAIPLDAQPAVPRCARRARGAGVRGTVAIGLAVWVLALAAVLPTPARAQQAGGGSALLREEAALALPAPAGAVAINADESILAAATAEGGGTWRVHLFDRPSRGKLGAIVAEVGQAPRLAFSPVADLLLIAGSEAIQLWELPIAPLTPDQPLEERHRRWEVRPDEPPTDVAFGMPRDMVYWSAGGALYRRSVQSGTAFTGEPLWQPGADGPALRAFAFDPESARVALVYRQRKEIGLLDLNALLIQRTLSGHRFPVLAARFPAQRPLLTLDSGNNLVQWQGGARPVATTFLDQVPEGFQAATFSELGEGHLLLTAQDGRALAIEERTARPVAELKADGPRRIAVSATGRYVLAGDGRTLRLYGFARPLSPLAYVRRLRSVEAYEVAQTYVRLLDDSGIPRQLKADLLAEAGREPPGVQLQKALTGLQQAEQEGDAERIRYWAEQVLGLQPDHPQAVTALRRLRERQDAQALTQAREALELGQNRVAISLLSEQVQPDSTHYPEAVALIREAEARRSVATALVQAREKLSVSDYVAAEALVQEALRRAPGNEAALALQDEIDDRSGASRERLLAALIGTALAVLLVGLVFLRFRSRMAPYARKLRLDEDEPAAPFGRGAAAGGVHGAARAQAHARGAAEPRQPQADRPPPRAHAGSAARRKVVDSLIQETDERLDALRQADGLGRHTAQLMELEAELGAIRRRAADPSADLGALHTRLKTIHAQVRAMRIEPEGGRGERTADGAGAGRTQGAQADPGRFASGGTAGSGGAAGAAGAGRASRKDAPPRPPPDAGAPDTRTHYEVLQVGPQASAEEIRSAYHKLLKQYHPDLHNASQFDWVRAESERMSRRIAEAYQVLSDAGARARYDRQLRARRSAPR